MRKYASKRVIHIGEVLEVDFSGPEGVSAHEYMPKDVVRAGGVSSRGSSSLGRFLTRKNASVHVIHDDIWPSEPDVV